MRSNHLSPAILAALVAAVLFGASTPFAKVLLGNTSPTLLAGLLYLGSDVGLGLIRLLRDRGWRRPHLPASEWPRRLATIGFGGVLGHQHTHDADWDGKEPHAQRHTHAPPAHSRLHYPDIHHRHGHSHPQ